MDSHIKLLSTIGLTGVLIILLLMTAFKFKNSNIGNNIKNKIVVEYVKIAIAEKKPDIKRKFCLLFFRPLKK